MRKINLLSKIMALCLTFVMCFSLGGILTNAAEENSLTISYPHEGAAFSIYFVAGFDEASNWFKFNGDFAYLDGKVDLFITEQSEWNAVAETLQNEVGANSITPKETQTVTNGQAKFTGLARGLYFVTKSVTSADGKTYTSAPFMVALPNYDAEGNVVNDLVVSPKNVTETGSSGGSAPQKRVEVVWDDNENKSGKRPGSLKYDLFCDGEYYGSVYLGPDSGSLEDVLSSPEWNYLFDNLSPGEHEWTIQQEGLPDGYTSLVTEEDDTFVIVNQYDEPEPAEPDRGGHGDSYDVGIDNSTPTPDQPSGEHYPYPPSEPSEPGESTPSEPTPVLPGAPDDGGYEPVPDSVTSGEGIIEEADLGEPGETLPQTGQLWWPMPILAGAGMILFLFGYIRRRDEDKDEE